MGRQDEHHDRDAPPRREPTSSLGVATPVERALRRPRRVTSSGTGHP
ncbi:hypothetical protein [Ilumatobacter sp.]